MIEITKWFSSESGIATIVIIVVTVLAILGIYALRRKVKLPKGNVDLWAGLAQAVIIIIAVFMILEANGIKISSAIAGIGIVGVIVAFGVQDIMKDTIMGAHIISDGFFKVGDVVQYENTEGVVEMFNLKTTKIRSIIDGSVLYVCNRDIEKIIRSGNFCDIDIPMSYDESPKEMFALMEHISKTIAAMDGVDACKFKGTSDFNASSISYKVRLYCDPKHKPQIRRNALMQVQHCLEDAGKRIPFNQLDIHNKDL